MPKELVLKRMPDGSRLRYELSVAEEVLGTVERRGDDGWRYAVIVHDQVIGAVERRTGIACGRSGSDEMRLGRSTTWSAIVRVERVSLSLMMTDRESSTQSRGGKRR